MMVLMTMHEFEKDRAGKSIVGALKKFLLTLSFRTFIVFPVRAFVVTEVDFLSVT